MPPVARSSPRFSGSETTEIAYALGRLLRGGLDAHSAVLPEATSDALDAFRLPFSAIGEAELVVVVGDDPVVERAPIVDLWIKQARRDGAEIVVFSPAGTQQSAPGTGAETCRELASGRSALARKLRAADKAVLIWSGPGGGGGARVAELAHELGFADKPGCGAFHLPASSNPRGVALAWAVAADADETNPEPIELLVVSGDEAASNPDVRALAEQAERVLVLTMFHELAGGWADLILPSTAALERDGTAMNLEGRVQRLRRTVLPPCPDELAWISKLAARFDVDVQPHAAGVFAEVASELFRDLTLDDLGLHAPLPARHAYEAPGCRADRLREQIEEPRARCVSIASRRSSPGRRSSASPSSASNGRDATSSSRPQMPRAAGSRTETPFSSARTARRSSCERASTAELIDGVVRVADEHAGDLHPFVEVAKP